MEAHLERVAHELAAKIQSGYFDGESLAEEYRRLQKLLAAALAARAREARLDEAKLARKAIADMDSRALFEVWLDSHIKCLEIAALERAVGEKGAERG